MLSPFPYEICRVFSPATAKSTASNVRVPLSGPPSQPMISELQPEQVMEVADPASVPADLAPYVVVLETVVQVPSLKEGVQAASEV